MKQFIFNIINAFPLRENQKIILSIDNLGLETEFHLTYIVKVMPSLSISMNSIEDTYISQLTFVGSRAYCRI